MISFNVLKTFCFYFLLYQIILAKGIVNKRFSVEEEEKAFSDRCVLFHNVLRLLHGSPPLVWQPSLADTSQGYANYLTGIQELAHGDSSHFGENLYAANNPEDIDLLCEYACHAWYMESKKYNYNTGGFSEETGHFTQMIWKSSELVGVGESGRAGAHFYIVARYYPPGNMKGEFKSNVQPLQKNVPVACLSQLGIKLEDAINLAEELGVPNPTTIFANNSEPCHVFNKTNNTTQDYHEVNKEKVNETPENLVNVEHTKPVLVVVPIDEPKTVQHTPPTTIIYNPPEEVHVNRSSSTCCFGSSQTTKIGSNIEQEAPTNPQYATKAHDVAADKKGTMLKNILITKNETKN